MDIILTDALRNARRAARLSQSELGARAGLARMTVQKIEAGAIDPRLSTLKVLLRALGLELTLVPLELESAVRDFIASGGRFAAQPAGTTAPPSIIDVVTAAAPHTKRGRGPRRRKSASRSTS